MVTKTKYVIEGENRTEHLFNSLERDIEATDKKFRGLTKAAGLLGTALIAGAGALKLVDTVREFGKLEAQLVTATGSSEAAQEAFAWIESFTAKTPNQLNEVVEAFVKLKSRGLDPSERALTAYGNIAAGMGKQLDQVIEAVADASTGEFERLRDFGILAKSQGDQVTFTFKEVATTVRKDSSAISGYLRSLGEVEFAQAMARQADTLDGALSNSGDAFGALARAIGDAGVGDLMVNTAKNTTILVEELTRLIKTEAGLKGWFEGFGSAIADIARGDDFERLATLTTRALELEAQIEKIQNRVGLAPGDRAQQLRGLQERLGATRREIEGLSVIGVEQAPPTPLAPKSAPPAQADGGGSRSKAFERDAKAFEKLVRDNEKLQREFDKDRARLADEQAAGQAKLTEELRSQQESRIQDLERSLLTERELISVNLEERLQLLRVARAQELESTMEYAELEKRVRADAAKEIAELEKAELDALNKESEKHFEALTNAVQGFGDEATEAFLNFVTGAKTSFSDLATSILKDIARIAIRKTITDPISDAFSGFLKGLLPTGSRATGGPAFSGQPLLVGEHGRELFVPHTGGNIVPMAGAGGGNVYVEVINQTSSQVTVEPGQIIDGEQRIRVLINEVVQDAFQSGRFDRQLGEFGARRQGVNR